RPARAHFVPTLNPICQDVTPIGIFDVRLHEFLIVSRLHGSDAINVLLKDEPLALRLVEGERYSIVMPGAEYRPFPAVRLDNPWLSSVYVHAFTCASNHSLLVIGPSHPMWSNLSKLT